MNREAPISSTKSGHGVSFASALAVWVKIAVLSFGGPAGQISVMYRILVEEKRWISESRFLHALNYCMFLPGPEAQQLTIYLGWLFHGILGGIVAGALFVLPGFIAILVLSILYVAFHETSIVEALFFGLKPAVLAIVLGAVYHIGKRALKNNAMVVLAAVGFVGIFFFDVPFPIIVLGSGFIGLVGGLIFPRVFDTLRIPAELDIESQREVLDTAIDEGSLVHTAPSLKRSLWITLVCLFLWFTPILLSAAFLGLYSIFTQEGIFFSKMAIVSFGGAYAVLTYVGQQAVNHYGWISAGEMFDGLSMAETTPGPLIQVVQFVGFMAAYRNPGGLDPMLAGVVASFLVTWVTYVPCFLWIFLGAPYIERLRGIRSLNSALSGVTAAVVGVILNLALWFAIHVLFGKVSEVSAYGVRLYFPEWETFHLDSLVLAIVAIVSMFYFKLGMMKTMGLSVVLGVIYQFLF